MYWYWLHKSNPLILKNVKKVIGDIPLVKPYKNKKKELTHFMVLNNITVDYDYKLIKLNENNKPVTNHNNYKKIETTKKKDYDREKEEKRKKEQEERLNEMLKNIETPIIEKPRKRRK